jgi:hypothetical protein
MSRQHPERGVHPYLFPGLTSPINTLPQKVAQFPYGVQNKYDVEEYGWDDHLGENDFLGNSHKWEVMRPTSAYGGAQGTGDPKHGFMDTPLSLTAPERGGVLATAVDDDYNVANAEDWIDTPIIDLDNVQSARLVFWHWYHFEDGDDGGRVEISIDGGNFAVLGTPPTFYPYANIPNFGPGFSGWSNGWIRAEIDIPAGAIGNTIRLRFVFATDADNNNYPGWYIDNIRIYGTSDPYDNNIDSDYSETWVQNLLGGASASHYLLDGEEYYLFGSSPFLRDTDGDKIYDNMETFHQDLIDPNLDNGKLADPLIKDIYIEMDYMDGFKPPSYEYSDAIAAFKSHNINMHIIIDDEITHESFITNTEAFEYYDSDMTSGRKKVFYYCLVADRHEGTPIYGVTDLGGLSCRFVIYFGATGITFHGTLMHELGHDMGQDEYGINAGPPGDWTWKNGVKPEYAAMKIGACVTADYLKENSDKKYEYKTNPNNPNWTERRFGGWEYAYTTIGFTDPQTGLCFDGLWYVPE